MSAAPRARSTAKPTLKGQRRRIPAGARERAPVVVARLALEYGEAHTELTFANPWQLLVSVILSAQTTDVNVNSVTPVLFARYPRVTDLAAAEEADVEAIIHKTGFFRSKARAIREMCQDLVLRHGGQVPARMEDLVQLRGVGRKTANVVLGVAFGVPGFAVDTHVTRLTRLLRLTSSTDPVKIEEDVCAIVPASEWTGLSLRLILHGRRVCIANKPRCHECVLADICPSADLGPSKPRATPRHRVAKAR
ncbi:MAG TPA: endonuclease III [Candidatus Saccharimonadales bacterium]|nr:endonuclease III [Candidatus Saccharimonadales bacterium]